MTNWCRWLLAVKYTQDSLTGLESKMWKIKGLFPDLEAWKLHNMIWKVHPLLMCSTCKMLCYFLSAVNIIWYFLLWRTIGLIYRDAALQPLSTCRILDWELIRNQLISSRNCGLEEAWNLRKKKKTFIPGLGNNKSSKQRRMLWYWKCFNISSVVKHAASQWLVLVCRK